MRRALPLLILTWSLDAVAATETDRLVTLARTWSAVKLGHPALLYADVDWDAALVAAIPKARAAKSDDELAAAVGGMLAALGDPLTRVEKETPAPASAPGAPPFWRWEGKTLVFHLASARSMLNGGPGQLPAEMEKATSIVVDARGLDAEASGWADWVFGEVDDELAPGPVNAPAQRSVIRNGFPPETGATSGGYYYGFVTVPGMRFTPKKPSPKRRVVFLLDGSYLPDIALATQAAGTGVLLAAAPIGDGGTTARLPLVPGWRVVIRATEPEHPIQADTTVPRGRDPLAFALELAQRGKPGRPRRAKVGARPEPLMRPDRPYAEMTYPSPEYRLLAVFRMWHVIANHYPYKRLIGDWDAVLREFIPKAIAAVDARAYALTLAEMGARVADGHTGVYGHPELVGFFGTAIGPVEIRLVEGKPVVVRLFDEKAAKAAGLAIGDVVLEVAGETAEARMRRFTPYVAASTQAALRARLARNLIRGGEGATLDVVVAGADGKRRKVRVPLSAGYWQAAGASPQPHYRLLEPGIGYADLRLLTVDEVPAMFKAFAGAGAVVFDMRGYPNGTAWTIAPVLNVKHATVAARYQRPIQIGPPVPDVTSPSYAMEQTLPPLEPGLEPYRGKTVMLIDDRTISQAEHTGLFFEAAASTTFIGSPTAGANGDVTTFTLPGGISMTFTGHDVRHADGRQLQRLGLQPHVRVEPTLAGIRAGRDEVLERAVRFVKTGR